MGGFEIFASSAVVAISATLYILIGPLLAIVITLTGTYFILSRQLRFIAKNEQLYVEDMTEFRVINGPKVCFLPLFHKSSSKRYAISLGPLDYGLVLDTLSGNKRIEVGPKLLFLGPYDKLEYQKQALSLKATEYARFLDKKTGQVRVEIGEKGNVVPGAYEEILDGGVQSAISLKYYEYVKVANKLTGITRVERGEKLVFLGAHESVVREHGDYGDIINRAIEIDDETAVLIRNKRSGQQSLVTTKQVFVPGDDEEVIEVRHLIKLAEYEACIVRGKDATDTIYYGKNPQHRSFFLPPHSELVELLWSRGRRREKRDLVIRKFDLRPMFMSFEFNCRTADNVELILEGSFFWEVVDLEAMHKYTSDTSGE